MAELLRGAPVAAALDQDTALRAAALRARGVVPTLAILRVGERADDLSYERAAAKRCAGVGVELRRVALGADASNEALLAALDELNHDSGVHGILLLRPLPPALDDERARRLLSPAKDVDGCTDGSLAGVFTNTRAGFAPCTAQAAAEILDYYKIDCAGKRAVVIGRSLVVGRPAAMLLLHRNATVTLCHSHTAELPAVAREADILVVCAGQREGVGRDCLRPGQIVLDVGIHWDAARGRLCGDVKFDEAEGIVAAITPVPGGVGSVTTAVLARHVTEAAERQSER